MTLKHKIKLIFARFKWHAKLVRESVRYSKDVRIYRRLREIQVETELRYLTAEREKRNEDMLTIGGELKMINRILNGN